MKEIGEIELSIQGGTEEIEALGEAGKVEESMEKLAAVEALKGLKGEKEKELQNLNETAGASGHQKLRVCETCVSPESLSVLESDRTRVRARWSGFRSDHNVTLK
jgi:RNA-binding protein Luc7-like 2